MNEDDSVLSLVASIQSGSKSKKNNSSSKKSQIHSVEQSGDELLEQTMFYEKRIYDLEQLLDIAQSFCSTLDFNNLLESIVYICMAQMHVLGAEIFTRDLITSETFVLATSKTKMFSELENKRASIPYSSSVTSKLLELHKPVTLSDLSIELKKDGVKDKKVCDSILSMLEQLSPTLIVPLIQGKRLNGILVLQERIAIEDDVTYTDYEKQQIMSIATLASVAINNASLLEMSSTDIMTHLRLKYYFFNVLTDKLDKAVAEKKKLAVIMFDIDFFKKFNDTYGHECGDYVLINVARLIKENIRGNDVASRYGGEEFTVMLENTGKEEAILVAERIRKAISEYKFFYDNQTLHVTISGGVSMFWKKNPEKSPARLVNQADHALYASKAKGRNRITYYSPDCIKRTKGKKI